MVERFLGKEEVTGSNPVSSTIQGVFMAMSDGGKGSSPRPFSVDIKTYENNYETIFGLSRLERKKREEALQKMVEENERLGLYDDDVQKNQDGV